MDLANVWLSGQTGPGQDTESKLFFGERAQRVEKGVPGIWIGQAAHTAVWSQ